MRIIHTRLMVAAAVASGLVLSACTGGSSGDASTGGGGGSTLLSGIAAAGAPVVSAAGYALDAVTGTKIPFTTSASGSFNVDLNGKTGPFLLNVHGVTSGGASVNLYSLASSVNFGSTVNVTPLSDVVVGYAAGQTVANLETACTAALASCPALFNGIVAKLALSNSTIVGAIPPSVLAAFGVDPATFNAITSQFAATHAGVDGLLDAIQVVPPVTTGAGASYSINLVGASPTTLVTVPAEGAGTTPAAPTVVTTPVAADVTRAANLVTALSEVGAWVANFNQTNATALPSQTYLLSVMDSTFMMGGTNYTTFALEASLGMHFPVGMKLASGALAPYSGGNWFGGTAPAANLTYDANNCVTDMWTYFGGNGLVSDTVLYKKAITGGATCTGTWKLAGNQRSYYSEMHALFSKFQHMNGSPTTYGLGFQFDTSAWQTTLNNTPTRVTTPYTSITITGPGLATMGNPTAVSGSVNIIQTTMISSSTQNRINDSYYTSSVLKSCAELISGVIGTPTAGTPCFNSNASAGSDYIIEFKDGTGAVLQKHTHRLNVTLDAASVPASWYPTITSGSVSSASQISTTANSTVSWSWILPLGASAEYCGLRLFSASGENYFSEHPADTSTSCTMNILTSDFSANPPSGLFTAGYGGIIAPIGGLKVNTVGVF